MICFKYLVLSVVQRLLRNTSLGRDVLTYMSLRSCLVASSICSFPSMHTWVKKKNPQNPTYFYTLPWIRRRQICLKKTWWVKPAGRKNSLVHYVVICILLLNSYKCHRQDLRSCLKNNTGLTIIYNNVVTMNYSKCCELVMLLK